MYFRSVFASPPTVRAPHGYVVIDIADAVDPMWIETILNILADLVVEFQSAADHFVCGRLVDSALVIDSGVDAGDMAAGSAKSLTISVGRHQLRRDVEDLDPGIVESAIIGTRYLHKVVLGSLVSISKYRSIQDGDTVGEIFAESDEITLHHRIDDAGRGNDGDVVDGFERGQVIGIS